MKSIHVLLLTLLLTTAILQIHSPLMIRGEASRIFLAHMGSRLTIKPAWEGSPFFHFREGHDLITRYEGNGVSVDPGRMSLHPLSLGQADFNEDGIADLLSGYVLGEEGAIVLHRGNPDAIYPHTEGSRHRQMSGEYTATPYLTPGSLFGLPGRPDLIGAGDFDGDGHVDTVAAARGSQTLFFLKGDGKGNLWPAIRFPLPGQVTTMAIGEMNRADGLPDIILGLTGASGPMAAVYEGPEGALLGEPELFPLPAAATSLALGQLDDRYEMDLVIGAGQSLIVIYGRDRKLSLDPVKQAEVAPARLEANLFPFGIDSLAIGEFSGNPGPEIAILSPSGEIFLIDYRTEEKQWNRIAGELDATTDEERAYAPVSDPRSGMGRTLVRARLSTLGGDDLVIVDRARQHLRLVAGGILTEAGRQSIGRRFPQFPLTPIPLAVETEPVAVLPARLNEDAIDDLIVLKRKGESFIAVTESTTAGTFVVNLSTNESDAKTSDNICDTDLATPGEQCTFLAAVQQANANPDVDTIRFSVTTAAPPGNITQPVVIDGTSAGKVEVKATIYVNGGGTTVRGLVATSIYVSSKGGNFIEGNFVGTDASGTAPATGRGIEIQNSSNNVIGGTSAAARNLISGNQDGVIIGSNTSTNNLVQGNYIGVDVSGGGALANQFSGINISSAANNTIGGASAGARNVISGNRFRGIYIQGSDAKGNLIQGNYIGTNAAGTQAVPNGDSGVSLASSNTTVGGTSTSARNVISGNNSASSGDGGVLISGAIATGNQVQGNYIGLDQGGTTALPNRRGIALYAANNTIGGTSIGTRNVISGNTSEGILISTSSSTGNQVQGNYIGLADGGATAIGNGTGIYLSAPNNVIGGTAGGAGNVISGNNQHGIYISTNNVQVQGNYIGTTAGGGNPAGNNQSGVYISGNNNLIGGVSGGGNTIAFNKVAGVAVSYGTGNGIRRNSIFSNVYMGIDLGGNGTTLNDAKDTDSGPNNQQNFPDLFPVVDGSRQWILNSTPNASFTIEFFGNDTCHSSGQGEGKTYLSAVTVTTDGNGQATISGPTGATITATATDANNNTSEFSHCGDPPTLVVNETGEKPDAHPGGGICDTDLSTPGPQCSLTAAISETNAFPGKQTIAFNIPGGGVPSIKVGNLPVISDPVILDATTQPGNGKVELDGTGSVSSAIVVTCGYSTIKGFVINRFTAGSGIVLSNLGGNVVQGNLIGTDVTGTVAQRNTYPAILIDSSENLIGGTKPEERNVLSGNQYGVYITDNQCGSASGNIIRGNHIGVDITGTVAIRNGFGGIRIFGASNNLVGGTKPEERNIISGNGGDAGVQIRGTGLCPAKGNIVQGNYIGLDLTGSKDIGNLINGVKIDDTSLNAATNTTGNLIGGAVAGAGNVISANKYAGVAISSGPADNLVQGNLIGTDANGTIDLGNTNQGVFIGDSPRNTIGGASSLARNLISGNSAGIYVTGFNQSADGTIIQGNWIGVDLTGTKGIGNDYEGISIASASATITGNLIADNKGYGIRATLKTVIKGNSIGTDASGVNALGNGNVGIYLTGSENTVGGAGQGEGNTIAYNREAGILMVGAETQAIKNRITRNSIYSNSLLGIDLTPNSNQRGVTPNDSGDPDTGANTLLNFPDLATDSDGVTIKGTYDGKAGVNLTIEVFWSNQCDPSGYGEGEVFLGSLNTTTDGNGKATFTTPFVAPAAKYITATATDPDGNTSEFSKCVLTGGGGGPGPIKVPARIRGRKFNDLNGNGVQDAGEPGVPGFRIRLDLGNNGTIDGSVLTDSFGNYLFPGLAPGANINIGRAIDNQAESVIAVNPNNPNRLFALSNQSPGVFLVKYQSGDGGTTWTRGGFASQPFDTLPQACCDPGVAYDAFGNLFVSYLGAAKNQIVVLISTNNGDNFTLLRTFAVAAGADRPMIATGPGNAQGRGSVWVVYYDKSAPGLQAAGAAITGLGTGTGTGNQIEFIATQLLPGSAQGSYPSIAIGPTGQVLVSYQEATADKANGPTSIFANLDNDGLGSAVFGSQVTITATNVGANDQIPAQSPSDANHHLTATPGLAWDRNKGSDGRVYLVYADEIPNESNDTDIFVRYSDDSGKKWSKEVRVNDDATANSQFLPAIAVDQTSSVVAVTWHDARNDLGTGGSGDTNGIPNDETQLFGAISIDGGASFQTNLQLSAGTSNSQGAANGVGYGDYTGLAFHQGIFFPVWADNSNSTGDNPDGALRQFDIYTIKVSLIPAGTHKLSEVVPNDWTQTFPAGDGTHLVTTQAGAETTGKDFGNFRKIRICGWKFNDRNYNRQRDDADVGLSGWTIKLDKDDGTVKRQETTDANGNYCFNDVGPGTYTISEVQQPEYVQTFPAQPGTYTVTTESGQDILVLDFGNHKPDSLITGVKFHDLNGNGMRDAGEPGLAGWTIFIDQNDNGQAEPSELTSITNSSGEYAFTRLFPGVYRIREVLQPGWRQMTITSRVITIDLSGQSFGNQDFGNFALAQVTGTKYNDLNGNGRRDPLEPGLGGWTIFADANANNTLDPSEVSTVTNGAGNYTLTGLFLGAYRIREVLQPGWQQTSVNPLDVVVTAGAQTFPGRDFGNCGRGTISGQKYHDLNGNRRKDPGEPGLSGWTVYLDANDNGIADPAEASTLTDQQGNYAFTNLPLGNYLVREVTQAGWRVTSPVAGGQLYASIGATSRQLVILDPLSAGGTLVGDTGYSEINEIEFRRDGLLVAVYGNGPSSNLLTVNPNTAAATTVGGSIPGKVLGLDFDDRSDTLYASTDDSFGILNPDTGGFTLIAKTNQAIHGLSFQPNTWSLFGIRVGAESSDLVKIDPLTGTLTVIGPTGFKNVMSLEFSPEGALYGGIGAEGVAGPNGGALLTINPETGAGTLVGSTQYPSLTGLSFQPISEPSRGVHRVTLQCGQQATGRDFGNFRLATLSGRKYHDQNGNGAKDPNEPGLHQWTIYLDLNLNERLDPTEPFAVTDQTGNYSFSNLFIGRYRLREVSQPGWRQTSAPLVDVMVNSGGLNITQLDFGNQEAAKPLIQRIMPPAAPAGTEIMIMGENFGPMPADTMVLFGTTPAQVKTTSATMLTTEVPAGIAAGPVNVKVQTAGLTSDPYPFFVGTPQIKITPAEIDFGALKLGQSGYQPIMVSNTGDAPLTIYSFTSSNHHFAIPLSALPIVIAPGGSQTFVAKFTPTAPGPQTGVILVSSNAMDGFAAAIPMTGRTPDASPTETLTTDDGSAETGAIQDGLIVVNRLTPKIFPATLRSIRIFIAQFQGLPSPVGSQIKLIAFADPSGKGQPPSNPTLLLNQTVTIPSIPPEGQYLEFEISNGPTINAGDLYVGFQAPSPAGGVVFAADSNGPPQQRAFYSTNNGASYEQLLGLESTATPESPSPIRRHSTLTPVNMMIGGKLTGVGSCSYELSPLSQAFSAGGGTGSITIATQSGCPWTAASTVDWINIDAGASSQGNGQAAYSVIAGNSSRQGLINVAGNTFLVAQGRQVASVSSASYSFFGVASESIATAFGLNLAATLEIAQTVPLPTSLAGTSVIIRDSIGTAIPAPLFYVSPQQVNFQMPAGLLPGVVTVTIVNQLGEVAVGTAFNDAVAPGLFTSNADGDGPAAAQILRIKADDSLSYEPVTIYDVGLKRYVLVPIDLGPESDQVFLVLYGTGMRFRSSLSAAKTKVGGEDCEVLYTGPQGQYVGLDQINVRLPRSLAGRGVTQVQMIVDGRQTNSVQVQFK